jgi:molybdenum cofactor biosynthesis enzyme MoaA
MVLSDFNYHKFRDNLEFCIDHKIDLVEFLELINFDFRQNGRKLRYGISFQDIFKEYRAYFKNISYNKKLGKYVCETFNGLTMQFADDFCKSRVCKNLWTRIDSSGALVPCIKSKEKISLNNPQQFIETIEKSNDTMCDATTKNGIKRDYNGELLPEDIRGDYQPSYIDILRDSDIHLSHLDL